MNTNYNHLRLYRKQTPLTLNDAGALLGLNDFTSVSRWELGLRKPNLNLLVLYHLIFNIPIESLLEPLRYEFKPTLIERTESLITKLHNEPTESNVQERISFLRDAIDRITSEPV